jgi:hypothetical protein
MLIINKPSASMEQCQTWINNVKTAHPLAKAMIPLLYNAALANGIDPVVLIAQAMKETGYFNFQGVIRPNFCNTCGLKVTKGGGDQDPGAHKRFEYWEDGIMAHSDHLALYAGAPNMPKYSPDCASHSNEGYKHNGETKDPRHFTYLLGKCPTVESLGGNWAPSADYGNSVVQIANQIINTKAPTNEYKDLYEQEIQRNQTLQEKQKQKIKSIQDKLVQFQNLITKTKNMLGD